jgi:hypothetical protein
MDDTRADGDQMLKDMLAEAREPNRPPQPDALHGRMPDRGPPSHDPQQQPQGFQNPAHQAAQERAALEQAVALANAQQQYEQRIVHQAAQAAAAAMQQQMQQMQQAPPGGYDPNADPYTQAAVEREVSRAVAGINEQLAGYSQRVEAFNRSQINEQLNVSEARARAQYGDEVDDAAQRMALERGVSGAYVMRGDPYGDLMRDWTEVGQKALGSDGDFFANMFARKRA